MANYNSPKMSGGNHNATNNMGTGMAASATHTTYERIAKRAYHIWMERGQPHGQDMEHWLMAEREMKGKK
jgi:hypothetical protein